MPERGKILGVIPARFGSTRFPGKPLALIAGKPMVLHVLERLSGARRLAGVVVATDDQRIRRVVEEAGGRAVITSESHPTGTDRVAEVARGIDAEGYVNVQGDEPLIDPDHADRVAQELLQGEEMATLAAPLSRRSDLFDQNAAKIVLDRDGYALYFSRSPIPFPRKYLELGIDVDIDSTYLRHVGVYGYRTSALERLAAAGPCEAEELESLEQIRALYLGLRIKVAVVEGTAPSVDVPEDIGKVERFISGEGKG
jgi:3-deoxy-manno-octulosonate cytidylyltransferase (CMP-KDO synthetase)